MSRRDRRRVEALTSDAVLFGLDADGERELALLGRDDAEIALELVAAEVAAAAFASSADAVEPLPHALAARVLRSVPRSAPSVERRSARGWAAAGWLVAAAAILLAFAGWTRRPPPPGVVVRAAPPPPSSAPAPGSAERERAALLALPGTSTTAWKATKDDAGAGASGDVVWHSGVQRGVMRFEGLAPNDPSRFQYQLWIFDAARDEARPVDGGVFDVGSNGELLVPVTAKLKVSKATLFAVTVERPGGVVVSNRERIVLTASPSS